MKQTSSCSFLFFLLLLAPALEAAETDRLLARWRGGELRESLFEERYASGRKELDPERFKTAICKASFQEIYGALAQRQGLDRSPEYRDEMAGWKRKQLATLWSSRQMEELKASLDREEVIAEWKRQSAPGGELHPSTRIDVDIVFLPCGLRPGPRQECRERAAALDRRLATGEDFGKLALEQREKGGRANGGFHDISLAILSADLRRLVEETSPGQLSGWLEAPHGLFRLRLQRMRAGKNMEMSAFEPKLRQDLLNAKLAQRVEAERRKIGLAAEATEEEVKVQAALRLGLERDETFLRRQAEHSRWWLADQAFLADREHLPSDEELSSTLKARRDEFAEVELEVLFLDVEDARTSLERAGRIEERLASAEGKSSQELFAALPKEFPELRRVLLPPFRLSKLTQVVQELEKPLAGLNEGEWRGPIALAEKDLAQAIATKKAKSSRHSGFETLVFVRVARRALPTLDAVRSELYREERGRLGGGTAYFVPAFKKLWDFELLPPEGAAGPAASQGDH